MSVCFRGYLGSWLVQDINCTVQYVIADPIELKFWMGEIMDVLGDCRSI